MTSKRDQGFSGLDVEDSSQDLNPIIKPARIGRPKQNPHAEDKKLTIRIPADLHRKLRYASVDLDKPMVEIAVDALIAYLAKHGA